MPRVNGPELNALIKRCNHIWVPASFDEGWIRYIITTKTNVRAALGDDLKDTERRFTVTYLNTDRRAKVLVLGTKPVGDAEKLCIYCDKEVDDYNEYHLGYHGACARKKRK